MKILLVGNFSDRRCGFQNFSVQTRIALTRAGHAVTQWDGTYSVVYARQQENAPFLGMLPPDASTYDVIHIVWHPATLNHYAGCPFPQGGPILSQWNGCPAATCPFTDQMDIRWGVLGREPHHHQLWYPVPDWVEGLPNPDPVFTVGYSGVRGDGLGHLTEFCARRGWATNFSQPDAWIPLEEEIRRLARSTVNVGWYGAQHDDRSGGAMMCLASLRPFLCNDVPMFAHLKGRADISMAPHDLVALEIALDRLARASAWPLTQPLQSADHFSWTRAVQGLDVGWQHAREARS